MISWWWLLASGVTGFWVGMLGWALCRAGDCADCSTAGMHMMRRADRDGYARGHAAGYLCGLASKEGNDE